MIVFVGRIGRGLGSGGVITGRNRWARRVIVFMGRIRRAPACDSVRGQNQDGDREHNRTVIREQK